MDARWTILIIGILMLCPVLAADDVLVKIYPIVDEISEFEEASYNISIINLMDTTQTIRVYSPNIDKWSIKLNPGSVRLDPQEVGYVLLRAKPKYVEKGFEYGLQLNIRAESSDNMQKAYAYVYIKSQDQLNKEYLPVLSLDLPDIGEVDPTEDLILTIDIENKNVRDIKGMEIRLNSDVISEETKTDLAPLQKKSIQFNVDVPSFAQPMDDNIILTFSLDNQTFLSKSLPYTIIPVAKQSLDTQTRSSFLKTENEVLISNAGNIKIEGIYNVPTYLLNYFLIFGNAQSRLKLIDGALYKQYHVDLVPGSNFTLVATVNYRPVLYIILAAIVIILLYYLLRSPLVIRKSVSSIKTKEGSLSELKVLIHIKNRTNKVFENIIVLDRIPRITEIGKEFEIGTIKPTKITSHEKKGTIAKWEIASLDSYEERVVAYKLYSNMNILGGLTLPISILKFFTRKGDEKKVVSNKVKLVIQKFEKK
ncbi:hypothetical protein H6503_03340 [Candidatus Woesearchaeota archaeon]|nr:hypothetical protein [Candidatus Woesearchaeota archaeon]